MRLVVVTAAVSVCLGCQPQPAPRLLQEEQERQEDIVPEKQPPRPMAHSHKAEPEYDGKMLSYWLSESKSESAEARRAAAEALGNMGPAAIPVLNGLIRDKDLGVRLAAAVALKKAKGQVMREHQDK